MDALCRTTALCKHYVEPQHHARIMQEQHYDEATNAVRTLKNKLQKRRAGDPQATLHLTPLHPTLHPTPYTLYPYTVW